MDKLLSLYSVPDPYTIHQAVLSQRQEPDAVHAVVDEVRRVVRVAEQPHQVGHVLHGQALQCLPSSGGRPTV